MPGKQNAKIGKSYLGIVSQLTVNNLRMQAQDIQSWVKAIDAARNQTNPKRRQLYELYAQIIIDGHLESVMKKRTIAVTNKRVKFEEKGKEGEENEYVRDFVTETPWFYKMIKYYMKKVAWSHALIEFIPDPEYQIKDVKLVPPVNVKPESGFLMKHYANETDGWNYREDPAVSTYLIEAGDADEYGLLMIAAQYVIYKRGGFGDWAQFAELFGMPFRVGKYNPFDDATRQKLEEALREMGGAGHAVIPDGTSLEFFNPTNSGQSDIFKDLVAECNKEISKIFVGQTMTTEDGSSRSQSETHKEVEEMINLSDIIELEYWLNWELIDKLRELGLQIPEGRFYFDQSESLRLLDRIAIDKEIAKKANIKKEYWEKIYDVEIEDVQDEEGEVDPDKVKKALNDKEKKKQEEDSKKKVPTNQLTIECCTDDLHFHPIVNAAGLDPEDEKYLDQFYNKKTGKYDPKRLQQVTGRIKSGLRSALPVTLGYNEPDYLAATMMELNINRFGFDKTLFEVVELNKALDITETFPQFLAKARGILLELKNHLETEYNLAIATAQNAAAWNRQKSQQSQYPYLRYQTVGDSNVREAHQALDGMIFSVDDQVLGQIYPPNGYNCRCEMVQVPRSQANSKMLSGAAQARAALGEDWERMQNTGFLVNRGDLGQVFDLNKHYVKTGTTSDNPENISFKDLYLQEWAAFRKTLKKAFKRSTLSPEKTRANFDKKAPGGQFIYKDFEGREIALNRKTVLKNTKDHYVPEGRHNILGRLNEILDNPDEVWLQRRNAIDQYHYIKFYNNTMIDVVVDVDRNAGMNIHTWYEILPKEEAKKRAGILIKGGK